MSFYIQYFIATRLTPVELLLLSGPSTPGSQKPQFSLPFPFDHNLIIITHHHHQLITIIITTNILPIFIMKYLPCCPWNRLLL